MPFCCFVTVFVIIVVIFVVAAAAVFVVGTFDCAHDFNVRRLYSVLLPQLHSVSVTEQTCETTQMKCLEHDMRCNTKDKSNTIYCFSQKLYLQ